MPSKFTDETRARVLKLIRVGNARDDVAKAVGISPQTLRCWAIADKDFAAALEAAEGEGKANAVQRLYEAGEKDWKATLAYLERKYPGEWGLKQIIQVETEKVFDAIVGRLEKVLPAAVFGMVVKALHDISQEGDTPSRKQLAERSVVDASLANESQDVDESQDKE